MTVVVEAIEADSDRWEAFVRDCPQSTFFHHLGWGRAIKSAYGYDSINLMAMRGGEVAGVLPLVDVKSSLLGRSLVSTAFTVGGGVAADDDEARRLLGEAARREGEKRRVKFVELRGPAPEPEGWATKNTVYAGFERALPATEGEILKMVPRKRRAELNKGIKLAASGGFEIGATEDVDLFYDLYAKALRAHGTPIFPRRFARALMREFSKQSEILTIRAEGQAVYAVWTFFFKDRAMPYYIGADPEAARRLNAYDFGMYRVMVRAAERGAPLFDFGRSKYGTGAFDNKTHWGFEPKPLEYSYALVSAREMPNVNPQNPKFTAVSEAWKKMPVSLAKIAGPLLARHLA
ncbi:MAG: FemAB family PEP-CTERM system-associated protein [Parvularculaceae bacterium]|nr:FemAB family PEP-CTERM system-associated protein [Parvularculaceae bacterium]